MPNPVSSGSSTDGVGSDSDKNMITSLGDSKAHTIVPIKDEESDGKAGKIF